MLVNHSQASARVVTGGNQARYLERKTSVLTYDAEYTDS